MKTISAKQFQLKTATVLKDVAQGSIYQVTFHGTPVVTLHPVVAENSMLPGSYESMKKSLSISAEGSSRLPDKPDYKKLIKTYRMYDFNAEK